MRDAIDRGRVLVAWALTTLLVLATLRVVLDLAFIERRVEDGFGPSAALATGFSDLVLTGLIGLALTVVLTLGSSGPMRVARVLLLVTAASLTLVAALAFIGAFAVFTLDTSWLQHLLGFLLRLAAITLLLAVGWLSWTAARTEEVVAAAGQDPSSTYHQPSGQSREQTAPAFGTHAGGRPSGQQGGSHAYGSAQYQDHPHAPHQYGAPQYGQPQYGQPQYAQPQYGQPQYGQPQYAQPQYAQPQYGQPQYGQPQYGQPQYGQSQHGQQYAPTAPPQHGQASTAPQHATPQRATPQYGSSEYGEPAYGASAYGAPQYGSQYAQHYGEQYGQQYGQPPQTEPPAAYGAPYAQQYTPSQYEQQHGYSQPEEPATAPYQARDLSEQGQPLDAQEPVGSTAVAESAPLAEPSEGAAEPDPADVEGREDSPPPR